MECASLVLADFAPHAGGGAGLAKPALSPCQQLHLDLIWREGTQVSRWRQRAERARVDRRDKAGQQGAAIAGRAIQYDGAHSRCITDFARTIPMTSARITTRLELIKQRVDIDGVATTLQTMG